MLPKIRVAQLAGVDDPVTSRVHLEVSPRLGLYGVARAMGGYCGVHPAAAAFDALCRSIDVGGAGIAQLVTGLLKANANIWESGRNGPQNDPIHIGHGATLACVSIFAETLCVAHVGDCRVLRHRIRPASTIDTRLESLTRDHNLTSCFALPSSRLNDSVLGRSLGAEPGLSVDVSVHQVQSGDLYVLLTDGVHRVVNVEDVRLILDENSDPNLISRLLLDVGRAGALRTEREAGKRDWLLATSGIMVLRIE